MAERITVVVGGFDALYHALRPVPQFDQVLAVNSTSELRSVITGNQIPKNDQSRVVFIFADTLTVDTPQDLSYLVSQLTSLNWKVLITELSPNARDLVAASPKAGFLPGPFKVNDVLYAISNLGTAAGLIPPYEQGHTIIDFEGSPWRDTSAPAPTPAPTPPSPPPVARQDTQASGWSRPDGVEVSPAPTPAPRPEPVRPEPVPQFAPPTPPARPEPVPQFAPPDVSSSRVTPPPGPSPVQPWAPPARVEEPYYPQAPARTLQPRRDGPAMPPPNQGGSYADYPPQVGVGQRRARVISVASPKGGTGKSSLTLNLAVALGLRLRKYGKRVCIIDANFQQADAGKLLDHYSPNIVNLSKDRAAIVPEQIERYLIHKPEYNISALLGPAIPSEANPALFTGALYNSILEALRPNFDYIFIDTPVAEIYHDIFKNFALPQSDFIIVPITPSYHTIMNADSWLSTITLPTHANGEGVDPSIIGIVLNQQRDNVGITEEEVQHELFHWKYLGSIPDTNEWVRAINNNELIATKNIHELNVAFGKILYAATGEQEMLYGIDLGSQRQDRRGIMSRLRRR